jgi:hypothetical protein
LVPLALPPSPRIQCNPIAQNQPRPHTTHPTATNPPKQFTDPAAAVADSISSLDKDVVDEVILDVASGAELRNPELRAKKLESIERQVGFCCFFVGWMGGGGCVDGRGVLD